MASENKADEHPILNAATNVLIDVVTNKPDAVVTDLVKLADEVVEEVIEKTVDEIKQENCAAKCTPALSKCVCS